LILVPVRNVEYLVPMNEGIHHESSILESLTDMAEHLPLLTERKLKTFPDDYILFFWTYTAFYVVDRPSQALDVGIRSHADYATEYKPTIRDTTGKAAGSVNKIYSVH